MNQRRVGRNDPPPPATAGAMTGLRALVAIVTAAMLVGGIGWGGKQFYRALDTPVEMIGVNGPLQRVSRQEIEALVVGAMNGGFLSLKLATIRDALEAHPWIESARVQRTWPKGLLISFAEETPIARWGDNAFLNRSGLVLTAANSTGLDALLQLAGPPGSEREVMREYSDLVLWLQPTGLKISTLSLDNRGSWSAQFEGGLRLLLGREQISARVHRFLVVWDLVLRERGAEVAQVDVRYDGGLAVQWQKTNEAG